MRATLTDSVVVEIRPTNSSMILGGVPAAGIVMGAAISLGMPVQPSAIQMKRPRAFAGPGAARALAECAY